jgi:hypothetical protein
MLGRVARDTAIVRDEVRMVSAGVLASVYPKTLSGNVALLGHVAYEVHRLFVGPHRDLPAIAVRKLEDEVLFRLIDSEKQLRPNGKSPNEKLRDAIIAAINAVVAGARQTDVEYDASLGVAAKNAALVLKAELAAGRYSL